VAVLSGNRNFEGRIHPLARASYLASPPLVVAFALAGRIDVDLATEPIGTDRTAGRSCSPSCGRRRGGRQRRPQGVSGEVFRRNYASVFDGDERWRDAAGAAGDRYAWDPDSTYVARPPFFDGLADGPRAPTTSPAPARWPSSATA
jgi:aconitate hydratase